MTPVRRQRLMPSVHLAGSFILIRIQAVDRPTAQRRRCDNVLILVLLTPTVKQLSGEDVSEAAGYIMRNLVHVPMILTMHSLKSSDDVTIRQVGLRDLITRLYTVLRCKLCQ